ncbi:MAG: nucleotidyltransferase domain-containing protein [Tannerella sp.]|jgi:predicted nucleotidyltransferase|nr:nucleotidyltransferase domain-containing protein [Tannerella sp.]
MLTRDAAIDTVRRYADEIEAKGVVLREVILFVSFARGTQHEWSDIDVALVADNFTGSPADHDLFPRIGIKKPYIRIESKTYPTEYFRKGDPFIEEIRKTGIVVLEK